MYRNYEKILLNWLDTTKNRKPLVLRGARQVGKTWLVRRLAEQSGKELIEINFERDQAARTYFKSNHPDDIIKEISFSINRQIVPEKTLLFLD